MVGPAVKEVLLDFTGAIECEEKLMQVNICTRCAVVLHCDQTEKFSGWLCNYSHIFKDSCHMLEFRQLVAVLVSSKFWNMTR